jgi:hypothetical protein
MDADIENIVQASFDDEVLNANFTANFPDLAALTWSRPTESAFAHSLGFSAS